MQQLLTVKPLLEFKKCLEYELRSARALPGMCAAERKNLVEVLLDIYDKALKDAGLNA
jgi:hypothetical protein